jgi:membrane protease YdiL (CAAX protease family)
MKVAIGSLLTIRWHPGRDTIIALLTAVLMIPIYYTGTHERSGLAGLFVFVIFGNGILNVLFPAYYVLLLRGEGPEGLGITTRRLWLAVLLSLVCSLFSWKGLQREAALSPDVDLLRQLVFNGIILWEPLFVFGWLQLRFERAFGILPGIVLAAICFGAYHLGTFSLPGVVGLVVVGVICGVVFRITKNLLTLWPATWAVFSSIGTMQGKMHFGWDQIAIYGVILLIQIAAITWMILHSRKSANRGSGEGPQSQAAQ